MASKIKLIASDMDGTLLDENGQVPPETFDLILALREHGVRFVASSGRRYDRLCDFFSPVKDHMDFVASNGAQVFADGVQIDREVYSHLAIRRLAKTVAMFPNMHLALFDRTKSYLLDDEDKFVREVDVPAVKVMLDTFHMNIEEDDIGGAIRSAKGVLGHFHTGECNRRVPGKGRTPWHEIACALRDIDYRGSVVMEPFVRMGGTVGSDIKIWRDISCGADEARLDADAASALEFERYMFETL